MNPVEIYESLFQFEKSRDHKNEGYPIHKRLVFDNPKISDIYDWIIVNFQFEDHMKVLDAGCGVGYGSIKLAKHKLLSVTGISISESEVNKANKNATYNGLQDRLQFVTSNFENAPGEQYDYIIAVESLKHSLDLKTSLRALEDKLSPKGKLIIIEDFYQSNEVDQEGRLLMKDWSLVDLFRVQDFENVIEKEYFIELTKQMPHKSGFSLFLRSKFLGMMSHNPFSRKKDVYRIFRGGILLDLLFSKNLMKYGVFVHEKK